jgi:hypothetical protein
MKRKEPDFEPFTDGSFVEKKKGKQPSKNRPEFDETLFNLQGLSKTNPPLDLFFQVLQRPKNAKIFMKERTDNTKVNRGTIYSILSLQEIFYPDFTTACNSDLDCIKHLLLSKLVTLANYENVFKALNGLMNPILYSDEKGGAESTYRSGFLDTLQKHTWYKSEMREHLKSSKTFFLNPVSLQILKNDRVEKTAYRLRNVIQVPDLHVFELVKILIKEAKRTYHDEKWLNSSIQLVQASVGSRWIEATNVSKFSLSPDDKYDPDVYIVCTGLAKTTRTPKIVETKNGNVLEEIDDDDDLEVDAEGLIVKPVLWPEYGVTPKFIIQLVKDIRSYLALKLGKEKITNSKNDMKLVRDKFLGKAIALFDNLWKGKNILHKFRNKTHTWRKIYGSYSHKLFNRDGNINSWLMDVLGHISLITSFSYANLTVIQYVTLQDKDVLVEYSRLLVDYDELKKTVEEQKKILEFLMSRPSSYKKAEDKEEEEEDSGDFVALPSTLGGGVLVNVRPFDISNKKFRKKDQQDEQKVWVKDYKQKVVETLNESKVDISSLNDSDLNRLRIVRKLGREIVKEFIAEPP